MQEKSKEKNTIKVDKLLNKEMREIYEEQAEEENKSKPRKSRRKVENIQRDI